jgi:hypothetical protein
MKDSDEVLHVDVQFSQHHLLKTFFSPVDVFGTFVKNKLGINAWVYFRVL